MGVGSRMQMMKKKKRKGRLLVWMRIKLRRMQD